MPESDAMSSQLVMDVTSRSGLRRDASLDPGLDSDLDPDPGITDLRKVVTSE
jgi:hypothetical protein